MNRCTLFSGIGLCLLIHISAFGGPPESDTEQSCSVLMQSAPKILWQQLWAVVQEQTPGLTHQQRAALLSEAGAFSVPHLLRENWRVAPLQEALILTQALLTADEIALAEKEFDEWLLQMIPMADRQSAMIARLVHSSEHDLRPHSLFTYTRHIGNTRFVPAQGFWIELFHNDGGAWASRVSLPPLQSPSRQGLEQFGEKPDFGPVQSGKLTRVFEPLLSKISARFSRSINRTLHASISTGMDKAVSYGEDGTFPALWDLSARPAAHQLLPLTPPDVQELAELATAEISPDGQWVAVVTGPPHDRSKLRAYVPRTLRLRIWDVKKHRYLPTRTEHQLSAVTQEGIGLRYEEIRVHWGPQSQSLLVTARDHYRAEDPRTLLRTIVRSVTLPAVHGGWLFSLPEFALTQHFPSQKGGIRNHSFSADGTSLLILGDGENDNLALKHLALNSDSALLPSPLLEYSIQQWAQLAVGRLDGMPIAFAVSPQADLWMAAPEGWVLLAHGFPTSSDPRLPFARVSQVHWIERSCELLAEFPAMGLLRWDLRFLSPRCR